MALIAGRLGCSLGYLNSGTTPDERAELRVALDYARLALDSGEIDEAVTRFTGLAGDPRIAGDAELERDTHWGYALALEAAGSLEGAIVELAALWDVYRAAPTADAHERRAAVAIAYCRCLRESGALSRAVAIGETALADLGARSGTWSDPVVQLGATLLAAYHERGDLTRAHQLAVQLVTVAESGGGPRAKVAAYWNAGMVVAARGRHDAALRFADRALAIATGLHDQRSLARLRMTHGELLVRAGHITRGRALLCQAERALVDSSASAVDISYCRAQRSWACTLLGDPAEAVELARCALAGLGAGTRLARTSALLALGHAQSGLGQTDDAREALAEAAEQMASMQASREAAQVSYTLGGLLADLGDHPAEIGAYRHALDLLGL